MRCKQADVSFLRQYNLKNKNVPDAESIGLREGERKKKKDGTCERIETKTEYTFVCEVLSRDLREELLWEIRECLQRSSALCFHRGDSACLGSPFVYPACGNLYTYYFVCFSTKFFFFIHLTVIKVEEMRLLSPLLTAPTLLWLHESDC